jgi:hypothetical protein
MLDANGTPETLGFYQCAQQTGVQHGPNADGTEMTWIYAYDSGCQATAPSLTISIPVWPLVVGSWSCPTDYYAGLIYQPGEQPAYYVGANSLDPTDACSIQVTAVGTTVSGTFSGTVGGNYPLPSISLTNGTFSFPNSGS